MAQFTVNELGAKTTAMIWQNGDVYSIGFIEAFDVNFQELGGSMESALQRIFKSHRSALCFLESQTILPYSSRRFATTPAWSDGHNPEVKRSKGLSPTVCVITEAGSSRLRTKI